MDSSDNPDVGGHADQKYNVENESQVPKESSEEILLASTTDPHHQQEQQNNPTSVTYPSNMGTAMGNHEFSYFRQHRDQSLFVRNLPFHFRDEHLKALITELLDGREQDVELCRVKYSKEHSKTLQVGIVMLRSEQIANEVLVKLQANPRHCGRDLRAGYFDTAAEAEQSQDGTVQFTFEIDSLEPLITEAVVREHFEAEFGAMQTINIRGHFYKQGTQNGYGFVSCMSARKDAELSLGKSIERDGVRYNFRGLMAKPSKGNKAQNQNAQQPGGKSTPSQSQQNMQGKQKNNQHNQTQRSHHVQAPHHHDSPQMHQQYSHQPQKWQPPLPQPPQTSPYDLRQPPPPPSRNYRVQPPPAAPSSYYDESPAISLPDRRYPAADYARDPHLDRRYPPTEYPGDLYPDRRYPPAEYPRDPRWESEYDPRYQTYREDVYDRNRYYPTDRYARDPRDPHEVMYDDRRYYDPYRPRDIRDRPYYAGDQYQPREEVYDRRYPVSEARRDYAYDDRRPYYPGSAPLSQRPSTLPPNDVASSSRLGVYGDSNRADPFAMRGFLASLNHADGEYSGLSEREVGINTGMDSGFNLGTGNSLSYRTTATDSLNPSSFADPYHSRSPPFPIEHGFNVRQAHNQHAYHRDDFDFSAAPSRGTSHGFSDPMSSPAPSLLSTLATGSQPIFHLSAETAVDSAASSISRPPGLHSVIAQSTSLPDPLKFISDDLDNLIDEPSNK